jgi:predicted dehydrogenase/2-polyprenyl-3-methyl-5-hydroxy-6-metoxy-1,4-benzoquinol methylase
MSTAFNQAQYDDLRVKSQDLYALTMHEILLAHLRGREGLRILNAGCGSGELCLLLAGRGHTVVGIDPEPAYVALARENAAACPGTDCAFAVASIEEYRGPGAFDCVIATDVLEHIEDDRAALAKLVSLVRPGGLVLLTVPAGQWLFGYHDEQLGHFRRYSRRTLRALVEGSCDGERVRYFGFSLIPVCLWYSKIRRRPYPVAESGDTKRRPLGARLLRGLLRLDRWLPLPLGTSLVLKGTSLVLKPVALAAVRAGKHVLVEKPAARTAAELLPVAAAAQAAGVLVKVGFNHRFHPAFRKARELFDAGAVGPLLYVRGRYGHGGRLGYERAWRADPAVAGGGELLDQGVHLIDLARWFAGEFAEVSGHVATYYWDMPVEDNGFLLLRTAAGQAAWLYASCTEWKNLFCFEIFGRDGKLQIDGLGGSYGTELLSFYRMHPEMGPPDTTIWEYPGPDTSWGGEFAHFLECVARRRRPSGDLADALAALEVVERVYAQAARGRLLDAA